MKTILIIVLSIALLAAAFLTRPGKRELALHLLDTQVPTTSSRSGPDFARIDQVLAEVQVKDRWLWVDIERDGKPIYTGLFAHFIPRGDQPHIERRTPSAEDLARLVLSR